MAPQPSPRHRFARHLFLWSAAYGFVVLLPQLFLEARIAREQPPAITHPEYFYGFTGLALVFQVMFLVIATDPVRFRPLMLVAVLEKLSFVLVVGFLYWQGRVAPPILGFATLDLILGAAFLSAWVKTR
jgi:hypothetical protein